MKLISIIVIALLFSGCINTVNDETVNVISGDSVVIIESGESITSGEQAVVQDGLFAEFYDEADELLEEMTIEEKIGQLFLARYPGSKELANKEIEKYNPGGYILFGRDIKDETKDSLTSKINSNQDNSKIKMFIAVDEEGGTVTRVSYYQAFRNQKFEAPLKIYNRDGMSAVIEDSTEKSSLLKSLGINMNLAPVVDIPTNKSSFMYDRSMGTDSSLTSEFAEKIISRMKEDNMISCMKHFPGYGDNVDTHTGIAIDKRNIEDFQNTDFKPFIAGINAGAPCIMVNHNIIQNVDENLPASLSKPVHDILREELNYSGLIMTDDLAMDAVKTYVENGDAASQAIIAGNDMIITSTLEAHINEILNAIDEGRISEEQIDNAARRVIACKYAYDIIN